VTAGAARIILMPADFDRLLDELADMHVASQNRSIVAFLTDPSQSTASWNTSG